MAITNKYGQKISYDSSAIIDDLKKDISEFQDFNCWVWVKDFDGAKIITNYDFKIEEKKLTEKEIKDAKANGEQFEIMKATVVLSRLEQQNEIL